MTWLINIIDAGARYGIHPSMARLQAPHKIWAFEPDTEECAYLKQKYAGQAEYEVFNSGLGAREETRQLKLLGHRGLSTTRAPNPQSVWFDELRSDEGEVVEVIDMNVIDLDTFENRHGFKTDFLKLDIEGMEIEALEGARGALDHVLAVKPELLFDTAYGKATAPEIIDFLVNEHGFILVNLDYSGRGLPLNAFCPTDQYGVLIGCEAFFVRSLAARPLRADEDPLQVHAKLAVFCFLNGASDLAFHYVEKLFGDAGASELLKDGHEAQPTMLFLKRLFLENAYGLKNRPGDSFNLVKSRFVAFFNEEFPDRHEFFRRMDLLSK